MKSYHYKATAKLNTTDREVIYTSEGSTIGTVERIYDNGLKKLVDIYFDYRYFLKYAVHDTGGEKQFEVKKIFRRGKVWFEGRGLGMPDKYMINYENWRIGVPELFITGNGLKMKIDKEMEGWSEFLVDDVSIGRWKADYDEQANDFTMEMQIEETSPIQEPAFFIAIAQATLFIGV